jgi:hypothetical protein
VSWARIKGASLGAVMGGAPRGGSAAPAAAANAAHKQTAAASWNARNLTGRTFVKPRRGPSKRGRVNVGNQRVAESPSGKAAKW